VVLIRSVLLASLCLAPQAGAEGNLVQNGSFDRDTEGWTVFDAKHNFPGQASWSPLDANGAGQSGSIELRTSAFSGRETFSVSRCIPLPVGAGWVRFGGRIRVPSNQSAAGEASLSVEFTSNADCSGLRGIMGGQGGISNFDGWSSREETQPVSRGSTGVRFILSVSKKYVWQEGDQTGEIDDGEPFVAYFDDLFLTPASEPKGPAKAPPGVADFWRGSDRRGSSSAIRYGHDIVEAPHLRVRVIGIDGREPSAQALLHLHSDKPIRLRVELEGPKGDDGFRKYRLQPLTVAASNNQFNWGGRQTLEVRVYRRADPDRKALDAEVSEAGTGEGPASSSASVSLHILGSPTERVRAIRAFFDCFRRYLPEGKTNSSLASVTDEQLLASPMGSMVVSQPVGEYGIVARFEALETGFWHEPVFSEPVFFTIEAAPPPCAEDAGTEPAH